ncbi:MAG: O-antigen ligase family protein [Chloroflexi bacterium]|nr:O-antigen ligase family protein [Chloroflexota bacterium]
MSTVLRSSLPRILLMVVVPYMMLLGGTLNVILYPALQLLNVVLLGMAFGAWALARFRGQWTWHATAVDSAVIVWVAVIAVVTIVNADEARRALIVVPYLMMLTVGWYVLHDALFNGALTRGQVSDMVLITGITFTFTAMLEISQPTLLSTGFFGLPRIDGLTGNPNLLSAILVPTIGLAAGRAWSARGPVRVIMAAFTVIALGTMVLTYSRGGWIAAAAVVGMLILLWLVDKGWTSPAKLFDAWKRAKAWQKGLVVTVLIAIVIAGMAGVLIVVDSLDDPGRDTDLRTYLWEAAWQNFTENPVFGSGAYSTPGMLLDRASVPPRTAQTHAHNYPLQVLSEFGVLGGAAMALAMVLFVRAGVQAWRGALTARDRHLIAGGWAAVVGFGVHLLFDLAAWTPFVAMHGVIALIVMTAAPVPVPRRPVVARVQSVVIGVVIVGVLGGALWMNQYATRNLDILSQAETNGQWLAAADAFEDLRAIDPQQPVYYWTPAMLWAMTAYQNQDPALARMAYDAFGEAAARGMESAASHANMAAMAAQYGDLDAAAEHLNAVMRFAPDSVPMRISVADRAEAWGLPEIARAAWASLLEDERVEEYGLPLDRRVALSEGARTLAMLPLPDDLAALPALLDGDAAGALAELEAHPEWNTGRANAMRAIAAKFTGIDPSPFMRAAEDGAATGDDVTWILVARDIVADKPIDGWAGVRDPSRLDVRNEPSSSMIATMHFFRPTFARMIAPQFEYDNRELSIAALIDALLERP